MSNLTNNDLYLHKFDAPVKKISKTLPIVGVCIVAAGLLSGFVLTKVTGHASTGTGSQTGVTGEIKTVVGSADTKVFRDQAEGTLEEGGINGEGTHKLIRPGGDSQTVYLTSSVLDLSQFVGKKVRVWGETQAAQKAGWLMDVGRVETVE